MKNYIKEFNQKDSLLVITSYPGKNGEGAKQNAVACYSQNLLSAYKNRDIVVLADIISKKEVYKRDNLQIVRCWKPGSLGLFAQLLKAIFNFSETKDVLIQFEFNMLGSVMLTSLFPFFVAILRLLGKNVTLVQHQVINDLSGLSGHLNVKPHSFKSLVLNFGLSLFYFLSGIFTNSVIVHEEVLKQRLSRWVDSDKIVVIPHGLSMKSISKPKNKEFTILLFGYLSWYKGVDWLIKKVGEINRKHQNFKVKLLVAGGPSATLKSKIHYQNFLEKVEDLAEKEKSVNLVGYIPDGEVENYFSASDLIVFPYRVLMSASGPLSFALRFGKPFMVSKALSQALPESDIKKDIEFSLYRDDFERKLLRIHKDKNLYLKICQLSKELGSVRRWENIVFAYESIIVSKEVALESAIQLGPATS